MKAKVKVNGEPVRNLGVIPLATELVENSLERNPVVTFIGRLGGLLLRLLPRRKAVRSPHHAACRHPCRPGGRASLRKVKLESFSYSRVTPAGAPEGCPKDPRTLPEGCRSRGSRSVRPGSGVRGNTKTGGLIHG
jgi:hypothetical protein